MIGAHLIESPVLGPISSKELSGGVKTLILMALDDKEQIFNASACGDNCAKWIDKISRIKDITLFFEHPMTFDCPLNGVCIDNNRAIIIQILMLLFVMEIQTSRY